VKRPLPPRSLAQALRSAHALLRTDQTACLAACVHDFTPTRALFAHYAPPVDADAMIAMMQEIGAHCDCEIFNNVGARI
jgi:hypothetical protein